MPPGTRHAFFPDLQGMVGGGGGRLPYRRRVPWRALGDLDTSPGPERAAPRGVGDRRSRAAGTDAALPCHSFPGPGVSRTHGRTGVYREHSKLPDCAWRAFLGVAEIAAKAGRSLPLLEALLRKRGFLVEFSTPTHLPVFAAEKADKRDWQRRVFRETVQAPPLPPRDWPPVPAARGPWLCTVSWGPASLPSGDLRRSAGATVTCFSLSSQQGSPPRLLTGLQD